MDSGVLAIMLPAFAECLVLVGIHSYLGLHVIKRKVIFVDLALAQIAALGATVGFLFGMSPTSPAAFLYSMAFTFVGAAVFAASRFRKDRVPQEAVIGLVYAIAASTAILVIDKSPHGAEHIKDLLTGTILWVRWPTVLTAAIAYSAVGIFHFVLRRQFIRITEDPEGAFEAGMWVRLWDFFFYLSFGFVISFSVRTAGVLLVFVFLVAPAISAVLLTDRWRYQLIIGWVMGTIVSSAALYLSYVLDLPSGPTVVAFYGIVLLLTALASFIFRADDRHRATARLGVGIAIAAMVIGGLWLLGTGLGHSSWARDPTRHAAHEIHPHPHSGHHHDHTAGAPHVAHGTTTTRPATKIPQDPSTRIDALKRAVANTKPGWKHLLVETVLDPNLPLLFKEDALALLKKKAGSVFGYNDEADAKANADAKEKMRAWAKAVSPSAKTDGKEPAPKAGAKTSLPKTP